MPRYKLTIEYDGTHYAGWQRQDDVPSVQGAIETAAFQFSGEQVRIGGAGRTDAGVHATGQVAHLDLSQDKPTDTIRDAINFYLKQEDVSILKVEPVPDEFDARFSATKRHYLFRIIDRRAPSVVHRGHVWWVSKHLDVEAMHDAAQCLVGKHDFSTFRASECQSKSPVKTLEKLDAERVGDEIHLHVSAVSFLHKQVRSFAGSLKLVGEGKWQRSDLEQALNAENRAACGPVAPPEGLYLSAVDYPDFS